MCLVNSRVGCTRQRKRMIVMCSELALYHPECIPKTYCACSTKIDNDAKVKPLRCPTCGKKIYYEFGHKVARKEA